jgi:hypothetical protein
MGDDRGLSRRRYLAGVTGAVSLSGCLGVNTDGGGLSEPPALVTLALQYIGIGTVTVEFEVEQSRERVHAETYEMAGIDPTEVEAGAGNIGSNVGEIRRFEGEPWMNERTNYAVRTDVRGGGAASYTTDDYLDEYPDRGCPEFILVVGVLNGEVRPMGGPAPPNCQNPVPVPGRS